MPLSPLIAPVMLCGAMFGLRVYRHRLFESSFRIEPPAHPLHYWRTTDKAGDVPGPGQFRIVAGSLSDTDGARADMGISWMTGGELSQAIPPAYTQHIARQGGARQCAVCGRWWSPARAHAVTCSDRCRKALSRSGMRAPPDKHEGRPRQAAPGQAADSRSARAILSRPADNAGGNR